jgi:Fur family zinc uptake transcriptional regulator
MTHCTTHETCIRSALDEARRICDTHGARLTPLRRRVLELVWSSHQAVKAYELLDRLSTEDHTVKPPTIYRALDFLLEQGLVHRVDSLNAFVGCTHPEVPHDVRLLICTRCGQVAELANPALDEALSLAVAETGFQPTRAHLEIHGLCTHCQAQSKKDPTP